MTEFKKYKHKESGTTDLLQKRQWEYGKGKWKLWKKDSNGNTFSKLFNSENELDDYIEQQYELIN